MTLRRSFASIVAIAAIALAMLLGTASLALAATGEPYLGVEALAAKLDASPTGTLDGYFKTVVKGATIMTIPVEVHALTGDSPYGSLIMFEAKGPLMQKYGGIVAGMSGSPVYVSDGGVDKVIGAVAYGDYFTLSGFGLATPIEAMLAIMDEYAPRTVALSEPILASGRVIDSVVVSAGPGKAGVTAASGEFQARPLPTYFIGGLKPGTKAYRELAASLTASGVSVIDVGSRLSAGASDFSTELVPGAAVGVLASRGDLWMGGMGTVTYADGDNVLAFGHPSAWSGPASLYMTNVWVAGVWPNSYQPYKIGFPSVIKGTITQDRENGVMGVLGDTPPEARFTADVTDADTGRSSTSSVWFSSRVLDGREIAAPAGAACSIAGYNLFDQLLIPGSADVTVTVVASNGTDEYTVTIANLYDDSYDVVYAMTHDADTAVTALLDAGVEGLEKPHIVSVDLKASVTSSRRSARIVRVDALAPLQWGDNTVRVSLFAYGVAATQTVDTVVTIPEGAPLTGTLTASCVFELESGDGGDGKGPSLPTGPSRPNMAEAARALNATRPNNLLVVTFEPSVGGGIVTPVVAGGAPESLVEATASTPWALFGSATAQVTEITASAETVTYGDDAYVTGTITGPTGPVEVRVYGTSRETFAEELLATGVAEDAGGMLAFSIPVSGITGNTMLRLEVDGGYGYTPAEAYVDVMVRARITLSATPKTIRRGSWTVFTAKLSPRTASGTVKFQYYDTHAKKWRTIISKRVTRNITGARATFMWRPLRGSWKVRAVYGGDMVLVGSASTSVTIKVR
jgi:hypothetical protein